MNASGKYCHEHPNGDCLCTEPVRWLSTPDGGRIPASAATTPAEEPDCISKDPRDRHIRDAFNGLVALIDGGHIRNTDAAKEVLREVCLVKAGRPEECLVCDHSGRTVWFGRYGGDVCPICLKP